MTMVVAPHADGVWRTARSRGGAGSHAMATSVLPPVQSASQHAAACLALPPMTPLICTSDAGVASPLGVLADRPPRLTTGCRLFSAVGLRPARRILPGQLEPVLKSSEAPAEQLPIFLGGPPRLGQRRPVSTVQSEFLLALADDDGDLAGDIVCCCGSTSALDAPFCRKCGIQGTPQPHARNRQLALPALPAPPRSAASSTLRNFRSSRASCRRRPNGGMLALTDTNSSMEFACSSASSQEARPASPTAVNEVLYTTQMLGQEAGIIRGGFDRDLQENKAWLQALSDYRHDCKRIAQQQDREQASNWREQNDRREKLCELRYALERGTLAEAGNMKGVDLDVSFTAADCHRYPPPIIVSSSSTAISKVEHSKSSRRCKVAGGTNAVSNCDDAVALIAAAPDSPSVEDGAESRLIPSDSAKSPSSQKPEKDAVKKSLRQRMVRLKEKTRSRWKQKEEAEARDVNVQFFAAVDAVAGALASEAAEDQTRMRKKANKSLFFESISEKDQNAFRKVFEMYDTDRSGTLNRGELYRCFKDIGLQGNSDSERAEIRQIIWSLEMQEVGFYDFALKLVPLARAKLAELLHDRLALKFRQADVDNSGMLSTEELVENLRQMGTFSNEEQVVEAIRDALPDVATNAMKSLSGEGRWIKTRDILDFDAFKAVIRLLQERSERDRLNRCRLLAAQYNLSEEELALFKHELVDLHEAFNRFCRRGHDRLIDVEVVNVVRYNGLMPKSRDKQVTPIMQIRNLSAKDSSVGFADFLKVMTSLREKDRERLGDIFDAHDPEGTGILIGSAISSALKAAEIAPRNQDEMHEIRSLIEEMDESGSGQLSRELFVRLCQHVSEMQRKRDRELEAHLVKKYAWSEAALVEFRSAFLSFDEDMNGVLDRKELVKALAMLRGHQAHDLAGMLVASGFSQTQTLRVVFREFLDMLHLLDMRDAWCQLAAREGFDAQRCESLVAMFTGLLRQGAGSSSCSDLAVLGRLEALLQELREEGIITTALVRDILLEAESHQGGVDFAFFLQMMRKVEVKKYKRPNGTQDAKRLVKSCPNLKAVGCASVGVASLAKLGGRSSAK